MVVFFFLMVFNGLSAQRRVGTAGRTPALRNDSSTIVLRSFDAKKIKDYRSLKEFQYDDVPPLDTSRWDRFWRWFWGLFEGVLQNRYSSGFVKYLVYFIAAGLVIFAVIKLIGMDLKIFAGKSKSVDVPYDELLENIHDISFNEEIEKAVSNGNYRLAVRLFYLQSLKLLNDRGLINWQPEKTNQAYLDEMTDAARKQQFRLLTRQFEYIWYGNFFIDQEQFKTIRSSFERFNVSTL